MATESYSTIIETLKYFSDNHLSLQRFESSFDEQLPNFSTEDKTFPILYASPITISFEENVDNVDFRIYCVDLLLKDRTNEASIVNQTVLILRDLTNWLRENTEIEFNVVGSPTASPVNNFLMDYTTGWYVDITIEYPTVTNDCGIPFKD